MNDCPKYNQSTENKMIRRHLHQAFFTYLSVKDSLKILDLTLPTTKGTIKKQYLVMAKKYHPDANEEIRSIQNKAKQEEIYKKLQEKFVDVSKAYQYLKDISEEDINSMKDKKSFYESKQKTTSQSSTNRKSTKAKMTPQQMTRQQAYEYFSRTYNRQPIDQEINVNQDHQKHPKKSLFKLVPQLFVGFALLAMILGDWSYRVYKNKQKERVEPRGSPNRLQYAQVFKGFNSVGKFDKIEKDIKNEQIDQ